MKKSVEDATGMTATNVACDGDEIIFTFTTGETMSLFHEQECCEDVHIKNIIGDLKDLVDTQLLVAEERIDIVGYLTYTFYTFRTIKGTVDITWTGESNGYYSEKVDCLWEEIKE